MSSFYLWARSRTTSNPHICCYSFIESSKNTYLLCNEIMQCMKQPMKPLVSMTDAWCPSSSMQCIHSLDFLLSFLLICNSFPLCFNRPSMDCSCSLVQTWGGCKQILVLMISSYLLWNGTARLVLLMRDILWHVANDASTPQQLLRSAFNCSTCHTSYPFF